MNILSRGTLYRATTANTMVKISGVVTNTSERVNCPFSKGYVQFLNVTITDENGKNNYFTSLFVPLEMLNAFKDEPTHNTFYILEFDNGDAGRILTKMVTPTAEFNSFPKLLKADRTAIFQNILTVLIFGIPFSLFLCYVITLLVISIVFAIFSILFIIILALTLIFMISTVLIFTHKYIKTFESAKRIQNFLNT